MYQVVADLVNGRVLVLSPTLKVIRKVVSDVRFAYRIWFDDERGRLYVADNEQESDSGEWISGMVSVYEM